MSMVIFIHRFHKKTRSQWGLLRVAIDQPKEPAVNVL